MNTEARIAETVGLSRPSIRKLRAELLQRGNDWEYDADGAVVYTEVGMKKMATHLNAVNAKIQADGRIDPSMPEKLNGGPAAFAGATENGDDQVLPGTVVEWRFKNRRVIQADVAGHGSVNVRVHSSENYRRGMSIRVRRDGTGFIVVGRSPRWPGRW